MLWKEALLAKNKNTYVYEIFVGKCIDVFMFLCSAPRK